MTKRRLVAVAVAVAAVAIQFVPVRRDDPPVVADVGAPAEVRRILVAACYDCHSRETRWPWYSRIAPVSWWIADHVAEGRRNLDFSRWPAFDLDAQDLLLREIAREVESGGMPPRSYTLAHPGARLSADRKRVLLDWAAPSGSDDADTPW